MRNALKKRFGDHANLEIRAGTADNTGIPETQNDSFQLVVAGNVAILWETIAIATAANNGLDPDAALESARAQVKSEIKRLVEPDTGGIAILYNKYAESSPVVEALHDLLSEHSKPGTYDKKISRLTNKDGFEPERYHVYFENPLEPPIYEYYDVELKSDEDLWDFLMAHTFFDQGHNLKDVNAAKLAIKLFFEDKKEEDGILRLPHYSCAFTGRVANPKCKSTIPSHHLYPV